MYQHNLKDAKRKELLPEGWVDLEVVRIEPMTSKAGNDMFKISFAKADEPVKGTDVYLLPEGKMSFLYREFLESCAIEGDEEGNFSWEEDDVIGKTVSARIEHNKEDDWIDRDGKTRDGRTRDRVVEFRKMAVE